MNTRTTISRRFGLVLRCLACVATLGTALLAGNAQAFTTPEQLIDATRGFLEMTVEAHLQNTGIQARHEVQLNALDPRLRLADCADPLSVRLESPAQPIGRVTVRVSCTGATPWTIFVPAQVRLYRPVVIATRALPRMAVLGEQDIMLAEREVGLLTQGYLTGLEQALGNKLTRSLQPDQVIAPAHVQLAEAIGKGDHVIIQASRGGMSVRVPGEALSAGARGQQIRVRNLGSGRVIKAWVIDRGQVAVDL